MYGFIMTNNAQRMYAYLELLAYVGTHQHYEFSLVMISKKLKCCVLLIFLYLKTMILLIFWNLGYIY